MKQHHRYCNTNSWKLLLQLIDNSATKGLLFLDGQFSLSPGASCKGLSSCFNKSILFFNVPRLFHWQALALSNTITSPDTPANVRTTQTPTIWTCTTVELVGGLLCSRKIPYRNIACRSPLPSRSFFIKHHARHISWPKKMRQLVTVYVNVGMAPIRSLPSNALHFPSLVRLGLGWG